MKELITRITVLLIVIAVVVGLLWFCNKDNHIEVASNEKIDITPEQIRSIEEIGQWEFLAINDEELVDTVERGFIRDKELVRIYYGTMRLGINIQSADSYSSFDTEHYPLGSFYDRSEGYVIWPMDIELPESLARNLPYANRGYVFKKKELQKLFSQFWWYMPDPSWQPSTADFTPREWRLIRERR